MTSCDKADESERCFSCGEAMPEGECVESSRECLHHCNCSWIHDRCCWCKTVFGESVEKET